MSLKLLLNQVFGQLPLRTVLIVPFLGQIVGTVGLVGYLSLRSGQKAVEALIINLGEEVSDRIEQKVLGLLEKPHLLLQTSLGVAKSGNLNLDNFPQLQCFFLAQIQQHNSFNHLGFGNERGELLSVEHPESAIGSEIVVKVKDEATGSQWITYGLDNQCHRTELLKKKKYDPRSRDWYQAAVVAEKATWSPLYRSVLHQEIEISAAAPVYSQGGELLGVFYSELTLSVLTDFLKNLNISPSGQALIIERSGEMVASTLGLPFDVAPEGEPEQLEAIASNHPLIRSTAQKLLEQFGSFNQIQEKSSVLLDNGQERIIVQVRPLQDGRGLDWLILVAVPTNDFMEQINANTSTTIGLCFAALIVAILMGMGTARWIIQPIRRLNASAKKLSQGEWDATSEIDRSDEVGQLAKSFNSMAEQLQESFNILEERIDERTALLSQTNQQLITEVAHRQRVEEKLRQSLQTLSDFKYALEQSAIVAITDAQGTITYVNDRFCQISQYERKELIDRTHRIINSGYHAPEFFQDLWSTIASGQIWRAEMKNQAKDGSYYWVDTTIVPFLDESGKPWQYLAIQNEITERKQIDRELRQFATQLQRSNRELKNFAYIVSHDLQEPLRKMKSFCQLLAKECQGQFTDNEKALRYLDYIIDAAGRQRTMIQALLNYSRLGRNDSSKVAIDLGAVVEKVLEDLSIPIAETQATVTVSDLPTVEASPPQMAQLFLNLIGNGIKFQGDATPRIRIEAKLQPEKWLISVQDNGIGINPKYAERVFQIFQRLHSRSEYSGTGIGLAICRKIVEGHGGRIWVASEPGQGSTFYFTLPVSPSLS